MSKNDPSGFYKSNKYNNKGYQGKNNNRSGYGGNRGNNRGNWQDERYVGAPYNFVSFYDKTISVTKEQMEVHNLINEQLLTGEIAYQLIAQTPVFIDNGVKDKNEFARNAYNQYAIPGSTMRGLIRNNVQILGLSGFDADIDDYNLMYRNIANGINKDRDKYNHTILQNAMITVDSQGHKMGVPSAVKAGYIENKNGKYTISPAIRHYAGEKGNEPYDMFYYILSERYIINHPDQFPFFSDHPECLSYMPGCTFHREERITVQSGKLTLYYKTENPKEVECALQGDILYYNGWRDGKKIYATSIGTGASEKVKVCTDKKGKIKRTIHYVCDKDQENADFKPYYYDHVPYKASKNRVSQIGVTSETEGSQLPEGCLLSSGHMDGKKALYLIPKVDEKAEKIRVPEKDVRAFLIDYQKKEKVLKQVAATPEKAPFFALPTEGEKKPVFYIIDNKSGSLYFGFTPRLRIFYDYSVKKGYRQKTSEFDYAKSLFGLSEGQKSYKSKVSFSDAVAVGNPITDKSASVVLVEPKATSYLDYLKQDQAETTYNTDDFELRGIKQYWLHEEAYQNIVKTDNEKIISKVNPLDKGTLFKGTVRFQNLTEAELGLLLWSITLEKNSWMNVGKAKVYGFGAVSISNVKVKTIDTGEAYNVDKMFNLDPFKDKDVHTLIDVYKKEAEQKIGRKVELLPHIKAFFMMKDSTMIPDPQKIRYMSLNNKEYQSRKAPLPSIQNTVKK